MLRAAIIQQKEERDLIASKHYQERQELPDVVDYLQSSLIKLITGPRRAGKSVFAFQLLNGQNFAYLNFDDDILLENFDENLVAQLLLEVYSDYKFLMLDEIQNLENWEIWVGKLYRRGVNLVITGSNAKLLSSEMATVLTGRYLEIQILPFSFVENFLFKNIPFKYDTPIEKAVVLNELFDYQVFGGFPEIINTRGITKNYLSALFDSVILKDITRRYKVRNSNELFNLANYLLTNFTNPLSINSVAADLNIKSVATAQKFMNYLADTFLFFYLPRFNNKLKVMQKADRKVYVVDNGFVKAQSFELSANKGRLLENMVFVELLNRKYTVGKTLFYYRTRNNREIDFVCRNAHKVEQLIQVSYAVSTPKTQKSEVDAIVETANELGCDNCLLITWDEEKTINEKNIEIQVFPVWKWLLNP